jgi:hypothetical protein
MDKKKVIIFVLILNFILLMNFFESGYAKKDDKKEDDKAEFTLLDWIDSITSQLTWFHGALIGAGAVGFFCMVIIIIWRYGEFPIVIVQSRKKYTAKKLGRFLEEERSTDLPDYWILKFKSMEKGVREYYCTENFEEMKQVAFNRWYIVYNELPHYVSGRLKLEAHEQFAEKKRAKGTLNTFKYVFYRICCIFIWNKYIIKKLYNSIEFEETDKMVKQVKLLQLEYLMNELTNVCDISYKQKFIHSKKGEEIRDMEEIAVPIYRIDDLKRNSRVIPKSVKAKNYRIIITKIRDFKDAVMKRKSVNEIRSIMELKLRHSQKDYLELNQYTNTIRETLRVVKRNTNNQIQDAIQQITEESFYTPEDLSNFASRITSLTNAGASVEDAVQDAVRGYLHSKDHQKYGELQIENERLKAEVKGLRENLEFIKENITNKEGSPIQLTLKDDLSQT